ncbi:hypothetical protein LU293_05305 [Moraxella nasovis]|uniref:hypothetical protein n=1 Tax=Moraxella nasovis TaxID=2904121 RepID=UPI001F6159DB|nr:hypothetical protein [Moraxella nasovis]UNU72542.1 hypothetical protein LU293_05305 [Moraxella nasovis]
MNGYTPSILPPPSSSMMAKQATSPISPPKPSATHSPSPFNPWQNPNAWYMGVYMGIQSLLFYTVASFLPSIGMGYGLSEYQDGLLALVFQLTAPVAIFLLTFFIKRNFPIRLIALACSIANAVGVGGVLWLPNHLVVWSALLGFGATGIFTLSLMLFSIRTTSTETAWDLSGMVQAVGYGVAFFGPLTLGKLFEKTGTWELSLQVLFALMCVNVVFGWWAGWGDRGGIKIDIKIKNFKKKLLKF